MATCDACCAIFGNDETLLKHQRAIHPHLAMEAKEEAVQESKAGKAAASAPAASSSDAAASTVQAASSAIDDGSNIEVAPVLAVLSPHQKDLLILRALQQDPSFVEHLIAAAMSPITPESAEERLEQLDAAAAVQAIRANVAIGAPMNAMTLLRAVTISLKDALENLVDILDGGGEGETSWQDSDELELLESLPAAGLVGSLWKEYLSSSTGAEVLSDMSSAYAVHALLSSVRAAAERLRKAVPGVLVGPGGEKVEAVAEAMQLLSASNESSASMPKKKSRR